MSKHSIKITTILCNSTSESGHDEVYVICQSDAGLPIRFPTGINEYTQMTSKTSWSLNETLNFEYEVLVTLWDEDLSYDPNLATYLQSNDFRPGTGSGTLRLTNRNGADYSISYTYID
jgi:hypothetical protein